MPSAAQFITLSLVSRSPSPEPRTAAAAKPPELLVIMPVKDWVCARCAGTGDLLTMDDAGPLCMTCADLDHLVFLGAGDASVRHQDTDYDSLLMSGVPRDVARDRIRPDIDRTLANWA